MDIVLLLVAAFAFMRRRLPLTKTRIVRGRPMVAIGVLFILPSLLTAVLMWKPELVGHRDSLEMQYATISTLVMEVSLACLAAGLVIAVVFARSTAVPKAP